MYPAEALASIAPHVPLEMLEAYRLLFEHMPTSFVFDRTLFVHAGIPRDDTFAERYRDLSSLNDPELRFQMMWSDPVATDHVPGRAAAAEPAVHVRPRPVPAFMERVGLHTLIRGHEKIDRGFEVFYDLGEHLLLNLFSSGGARQRRPPGRLVVPHRHADGAHHARTARGPPTATPWPLHYQPFNYEPHNGLYRRQPVLEFRYL